MELQNLNDTSIDGKIVLLRADLDTNFSTEKPNKRLDISVDTTKKILEKGASKVIIVGHKGRPKSESLEEFSLEPLVHVLANSLGEEVCFVGHDQIEIFVRGELHGAEKRIALLENLRFWDGEENNSKEFVDLFQGLAASVYVNEAFAASHREHASIVSFPFLASVQMRIVGSRFAEEMVNLSKLFNDPKRPVVSIIGGLKEDKLKYLDGLKSFSDKVLIAGRLPEYMGDPDEIKDEKLVIARLIQDKEDITLHSIENFEEIIRNAGTIFAAGPVGKFEEEGHRLGTSRVFDSISNSNAFKVAGGGDTERAIETLGIEGGFDWISVGGGASMEFVVSRTLPGIEALISNV